MKKSQLLVVSIFVSLALVSASSYASPGKKKEIEPVAAQSLTAPSAMDWVLELLDF